MKVNINLSTIVNRLKGNISIVLGLGIVVILLLEVFVIKRSVDIVLQSFNVAPGPRTQLVRINFDLYNTVAKRFGESESTELTPVTVRNPFTPQKTLPKQPTQ